MFPVDGHVMIIISHWQKAPEEKGPYKILEHLKLYDGSGWYYDLEGEDMYYGYAELKAADKETELYDIMTGDSNE